MAEHHTDPLDAIIDRHRDTEEETLERCRRVLASGSGTSEEEVKTALVELAHLGSEAALATLREYQRRLRPELKAEADFWDEEDPFADPEDDLAGFAQCAIEECDYLSSIPRSPEEEERQLQAEVREELFDRVLELQGQIDEEEEWKLRKMEYEVELAERLYAKATTEEERKHWEIQAMASRDIAGMQAGQIEEMREEIAHLEAMIREIEADLGIEPHVTGRAAWKLE